MACRAVPMWSLTSLITAFLDLTAAYLLLSASALAFFASKFLNIIGLNLPCPCHSLFFDIHSQSLCLTRLLVDLPVQKVSDVLLYVKQTYPFNGCSCNRTSNISKSITAVNDSSNGFLQIDCDASCSSVSDSRRSIDGSSVRAEKYDVKGKGIALCHSRRTKLRAHRKHVNDRQKLTSSLSYNPPRDEEARYHYGGLVDDDLCVKNMLSTSELYRDVSQGDLGSSGDEKHVIRILERALDQERASRAALYIELEKERSASATAADEAMSMILRLQEEKAIIEMESKQYQRIIEEKTAHDAEEMNILKEILVRREKEKLFLEKEVEGYRQMISLDDDDYYDEQQLFSREVLDEVEQSTSRGPGDLSEKFLQMKTECSDLTGPQECEFTMKIDTSDAKHDEVDEALSPEEKIIETCDGIESNHSYKDTSVEQQASTLQVLHERYYVPIKTSVMESLNAVTDNASASRRGNGTLVKSSSSEKTNAGLHLPQTRPQALPLLIELRRNSMSCADKKMLNMDNEVELIIEKLKLVRADREKLISSSIENQEQVDMRTKSLDDMKGHVLESDSRKVISQVLSKKRRCRSVSSVLWTTSKGAWEH